MTNKLTEICDTKRVEVAQRKRDMTVATLHARAAEQSPPRGFRAALDAAARSEFGLIAEIKKASPSKGLIRADFNPPAHAVAYQAAGAACLSVLTDAPYFQGHEDYLMEARSACAIPVLRKDFMVDPWQVLESRSIGADAILIIVAALDDGQMAEIETTALDLGMDVLIEVHDVQEMERASKLRSRLIGVNNRDLRDFSVDFARTYELIAHAPEGCTFVAESGLSSHDDLRAMAEQGVRCFLVGEALMREKDVESATRKLLTGA
ncbi:MAG: indole-3-glycerol phosphate synthase TrpC [Sphingobium sp.]